MSVVRLDCRLLVAASETLLRATVTGDGGSAVAMSRFRFLLRRITPDRE